MKRNITRRDMLKISAATVGGLAVTGTISCSQSQSAPPPTISDWEKASVPLPTLSQNEMRITFLGTSCIPRIAQECNSIFVETGNGDQFMFDCGSGVVAKYNAMGIPFSRMDKLFLTHLHGDHTSDLIHLYAFGPSGDRKTALKIWGPTRSNVTNPTTGENPDDGTATFINAFKQFMAWHVHSFSFLPTGFEPRGSGNNGYDITVRELDWTHAGGGTAYDSGAVTIAYFPAAHDRSGSLSYKLTYNNMSLIFSGDTKPTDYMIAQGKGVDVLIHEMVVPPETWAAKNSGLRQGDQGWSQAVAAAQSIQDSSHTPQKAFGYIMSQTRPRLAVATHFQVNEDTVDAALRDIRYWYSGPVTFATDLLVITVSPSSIKQQRVVVDDYAWMAKPNLYANLAAPEYPSPTYQLDQQILLNHCIPAAVYDPESSTPISTDPASAKRGG